MKMILIAVIIQLLAKLARTVASNLFQDTLSMAECIILQRKIVNWK